MASLKEIRAKVTSIKSTQKITRAMQMVAASKMRRAQERMEAGRPYADSIRNLAIHLLNKQPAGDKHPYMVERPVKTVAFLVITSDRGLAGGLNINLFKRLIDKVKSYQAQSVDIKYGVIGSKGVGFFRSYGGHTLRSLVVDYGDNPSYQHIERLLDELLGQYISGDVDRIYVVYNHFINAMTQKPMVEQLLPLPNDVLTDNIAKQGWEYLYELPSGEELNYLLDGVLTRYVEGLAYQALRENIASEQSARMVAMKAATDNAGNLIKELQLVYNKLRQAAITQEISEIVGGAAAVSG